MDSSRVVIPGSAQALIRTSADREVAGYSLLVGAIACLLALPLCLFMRSADLSIFVVGIMGPGLLWAFSDSAWDIGAELSSFFRHATPLKHRDLSHGIPDDCKTLVAVPILLYPRSNVEGIVADLEARYLNNKEENLYFCLLTDLSDSDCQVLPEDNGCLERVVNGIKALNRRHGEVFFLLHRERTWNPQEQVWMGWERKRGKLAALNEFLISRNASAFSETVGYLEDLAGIRYVITLDSDSPLPAGSAVSLISTISHPDNRPVVDDTTHVVVKGYGIIQPIPKVVAEMPGASRLQWLVRSPSSLGPDLYQQLYGEGSFYGKGIYDVRVFQEVLGHRFPENLVLSHDLLEGAYLRCAISYQAILPEEHPCTYLAETRRRHRWTRGDWQTSPWLFNSVSTASGGRERNPISLLSRWKVFDNIRRTLVPATFLVVLVVGWALNLGATWAALMVAVMVAPILAQVVGSIARSSWRDLEGSALVRALVNRILWISYLPYESANGVDAVFRSLWRMKVSRTYLLEWTPSGEEQAEQVSLLRYMRVMWISPALAISCFLWLFSGQRPPLLVSLTLLLWAVSPAIAWCLDRPHTPRASPKNANSME